MGIAETRQAVMRLNFNLEGFNSDRGGAETPQHRQARLEQNRTRSANPGRLKLLNSDISFNPSNAGYLCKYINKSESMFVGMSFCLPVGVIMINSLSP
jgi:hypothetical protein